MKDLSSLFFGREGCFLNNISLTPQQQSVLKNAREKIQNYLRSGIAMLIKAQEGITVNPKFYSQGSAVYRTRNDPCHKPPQQIDHDLGCYLPLTIVQDIGAPGIASSVFFGIADYLLEQLVKQEHWLGVSKNKQTCCRAIINKELHIDIPLYAIPDKEFIKLNESVEFAKSIGREDARSKKSDIWEAYPVTKVLLAHRTDNWKESDPRKLYEYFTKTFKQKGEQLRRICRYLKAWRDFKLIDNGPSSIYLMILADNLYNNQQTNRDDIAFLEIVTQIAEKRDLTVRNPVDLKEIINIDRENMQKLKSFAEEFAKDLSSAIVSDASSEESCKLLQKHFGTRFPCMNIPCKTGIIHQTTFSIQCRDTEEFIENILPINDGRYHVSIDCRVTQDGWRPFLLSEFLKNKKGWLAHHKRLEFFIVDTDVLQPYSVFWKVRNVGEVAERRDCIRGEIIKSNNNKQKENTDFYGPHYVECYIIKNGICVARDKIDVPIGNN
jgi:hypothetical protein